MRIYLVFNLYVISDNYNVNLQHEVTTRKIVYTSDVYCLLLCVCAMYKYRNATRDVQTLEII